MSKEKSIEYSAGWNAAVSMMRPAQILTVDVVDELLERCEQSSIGRPNNTVSDVLVPPEMLHELLVVWKAAR